MESSSRSTPQAKPGAGIDWQAVCLDLEEYFLTSNSHGQRFLLRELAEAKKRHRYVEGTPERVLRLYGDEIFAAIRDSSSADSAAELPGDEGEREPSLSPGGNNGTAQS